MEFEKSLNFFMEGLKSWKSHGIVGEKSYQEFLLKVERGVRSTLQSNLCKK